jgi:uncharacterized protein YecT (DUF1311 family)
MPKKKYSLAKLLYSLTLIIALTPSAHAATDPDWWIENDEGIPQFYNYGLFSVTAAQALPYDTDADVSCYKKVQFDSAGQIACNKRQYARIHKQLKASYRELMAALPKQRRQTLRQEQKGWLATRDAPCQDEVAEHHDDAEYFELILGGCRISELVRRTEWIKGYHGFSERKR